MEWKEIISIDDDMRITRCYHESDNSIHNQRSTGRRKICRFRQDVANCINYCEHLADSQTQTDSFCQVLTVSHNVSFTGLNDSSGVKKKSRYSSPLSIVL